MNLGASAVVLRVGPDRWSGRTVDSSGTVHNREFDDDAEAKNWCAEVRKGPVVWEKRSYGWSGYTG